MGNGQTTTFVMYYGDLNLEIFSEESATAVPVEFRITEEKKSEYMALAMGDYCLLNFRITELAGCSIWHTRFFINERMKLRVTGSIPCTFLWIVWKNTLCYSINKSPEQQIMTDHYNFYHLPEIAWEINFRQPGEYETFNILFTGYDLEIWNNTHVSPDFPLFLDKIRQGKIAFLNPAHQRLTRELRRVVSDMIRGPIELTNRHDFYENKILDLLFNALRDTTKSHFSPKTSMNLPGIDRLHEIRNSLKQHPENTYHLRELAQTAGMNETKLEANFKQLFGTTVFGFIHEQRMQLARRLLKERSYSVKEVAARTGYKNTSSFTHAFTNYFGFPPSQARGR